MSLQPTAFTATNPSVLVLLLELMSCTELKTSRVTCFPVIMFSPHSISAPDCFRINKIV